jgi:DNA-binding NarL/FixJ family response regulator
MIRVVLVDDHPVVRDGLAGQIAGQDDLTVVGEAAGGHEALALVERVQPDLVVTDLRMRSGDGVELIEALRRRVPPVAVLVLTTYGTEADLVPALEAGATSVLLKEASRQELFHAVRRTSRGETVLSPAVAELLVRRYRAGGPADGVSLSPRELEILSLVADGTANREIGRTLHISETTVKTHLVRVYAKLEVSDRAAAVASAYRRGLLPLRS